MRQLTNAEAALLGLLSEGARHPYQIEKDVQYRDMRYWTDLSISTIYKLLRQLEKDGCVDLSRDLMDNNRMRKVYSITETGVQALRRHIRDLLSEAEHLKWKVDVGLYNLANIPPTERRECLEAYIKALETRITEYRALEEFMSTDECPSFHRSISKRPQYLLQGELNWAKDFLLELEESGELS